MKKAVIGLTLVTLVLIGVVVYAHSPGWWGPGGDMMGPGYGGHMMSWGGPGYGYDQKFLNETTELRKELHNKRFEYFEALRNPETTKETITNLEKEIGKLQDKVYEKAPRTGYGKFGRHGRYGGHGCWL